MFAGLERGDVYASECLVAHLFIFIIFFLNQKERFGQRRKQLLRANLDFTCMLEAEELLKYKIHYNGLFLLLSEIS